MSKEYDGRANIYKNVEQFKNQLEYHLFGLEKQLKWTTNKDSTKGQIHMAKTALYYYELFIGKYFKEKKK